MANFVKVKLVGSQPLQNNILPEWEVLISTDAVLSVNTDFTEIILKPEYAEELKKQHHIRGVIQQVIVIDEKAKDKF